MKKKMLLCILALYAAFVLGRLGRGVSVNAAGAVSIGVVAAVNGDVNGDGARDTTDAVYLLNWLFIGGPEPVAFAASADLASRVEALEEALTIDARAALSHMSVIDLPTDDEGGTAKTVRFTGVNVQIVNGLAATNGNPEQPSSTLEDTVVANGVGNLIVGYNERRGSDIDTDPFNCGKFPFFSLCTNERTGSHNIVLGYQQEYTSVGGLVAGYGNTISGAYAAVLAGEGNVASGAQASVSGGGYNTASGSASAVAGGGGSLKFDLAGNHAAGPYATVAGGANNTAPGEQCTVSGGFRNEAAGRFNTVSGGEGHATGEEATRVHVP